MTDADNVVREFVRHKVFRDTYAVERIAESATVLACARVDPRTVCKHRIGGLALGVTDAENMTAQWGDYEPADLPCLDSVHLLSDIGEQERVCQDAERAYELKHDAAKAATATLDAAIDHLRELVTRATDPAELPLLDRLEL